VSPLQPALPRELYVDPDAWRRERDRVLFGEWFCVGRRADLGLDGPGRVAVVDVAGESVVVTCDDGGALHAAYNVCRHRGSQLFPVAPGAEPRCEAAGALRCPYHSWTYALDGSLLRAPHTDDGEIDPADFALHPVAVDDWAGFVFLHLTPGAAGPLADAVARPARTLANYGMGDLVTGQVLTYEVAAIQGGHRELQRVLPLRAGAPRAHPAGSDLRRRGPRHRLGRRGPAP
jgi:Rieske 2Fe-2S family protein